MNRRRGISLVELLCTMAVLTLLIGILILIIGRAMQAQNIQAESYDRLQWSHAFAEQFRRDVGAAEKAPARWKDYVADIDTLILQMANDEHIVYLWADGKLRRLTFGPETDGERSIPVAVQTDVEFVVGNDRLLRVRLIPTRHGKALVGQSLEIAAALGGDRR